MSDSEGSFINIGDFAQPVNTLIEKVSAGIGLLYEPTRIVKKAKAEAEADRIKAISRLEISEQEKRTLNRIVTEGTKQQERMESVLAKALPAIQPDGKPEELNEDWITAFFNHVRLVSDEDMQQLWARVLAGETNKPRTYSKRTLALLSNLEKTEAAHFTALCSFAIHWPGLNMPLVFDFTHQLYAKRSINFRTLSHLDSIGLIRFHSDSMSELSLPQPNRGRAIRIHYFDENLYFYLDPAKAEGLPMGKVEFTESGTQLSLIAGGEKDIDFVPFLAEKWIDAGVRWCSQLLRPTVTVTTAGAAKN
jgi:hypothetical protein